MMHLDFSLRRFWSLLKLAYYKNRKVLLMVLGMTFGVLFFLSMLLSVFLDRPAVYDHTESYVFALLTGGFIVSSLAFSDSDRQLRRIGFLMLPVSKLERLMCAWLLTCIGWLVAFSVGFILYLVIANPVGQALFPGTTFRAFNPFGASAWMTIRVYIVLQSLFLLGAAGFRGYVFPKMLVVLIALMTIVGFAMYFVLKKEFLADHYCTVEGECELVDAFAAHPVWNVAQWLFWLALAPLAWVMTYWELKDQEA